MRIEKAAALHLKAPLETPYATTFGTLTHRQAVIVMLTDDTRLTGVGETYINFPPWAPAERLAAYRDVLFPAVIDSDIADVTAFIETLWRRYYRAVMQGHALGPFMQALSAVSVALDDLRAKQRGIPLRHLYSAAPSDTVRMYASGINPPLPEDAIHDALDMGIDTFKLKLGFGDDKDQSNIRDLETLIGSKARVAVDVNRSWSYETALTWLAFLADHDIAWLEEPLDPIDQHRYPEFVERAAVPVSAGENFLIPPGSDFTREGEWGLSFNQSGYAPDILQPAIVKNCCFDDAVRFIAHAEPSGKRIYPHFLGSAPGMAASAQLAALTNSPHLEWDINPNPLRTSLFNEPFCGENGCLALGERPGIGWTIRHGALDTWTVNAVTCDR